MSQTAPGDRRQWVLSVLEKYEVPLLRFATRMLGDEDAAADVVQHVFLRLCEQPPDELGPRVAPWLFCVCRNKTIDLLRTRGRSTSLAQAETMMQQSKEPDPAATAERRELYQHLNLLVDRLPQNQREAVLLWSEGLSYFEIARVINRSEGAIRVMVHRAMKSLRASPATRRLLEGKPAANPDVQRRLEKTPTP